VLALPSGLSPGECVCSASSKCTAGKATCVRSHVCRLPRMKARGSTTRCHCMLLPRTLAHDPRLTTWTSMYVHLCLCVCVTCDEHARVSLPSLSRRPLYCAKHRVKAPGARDVVNLLCCWTGTAAPSSRPRDLPDLNASAHVTLPRFPRAPCASLSNTNSSSDICMRTGGQHADEARSRCTDSVQEDDISPHTPAPGSPSPSPNSTTTKRAHTSEKVVRSHTIKEADAGTDTDMNADTGMHGAAAVDRDGGMVGGGEQRCGKRANYAFCDEIELLHLLPRPLYCHTHKLPGQTSVRFVSFSTLPTTSSPSLCTSLPCHLALFRPIAMYFASTQICHLSCSVTRCSRLHAEPPLLPPFPFSCHSRSLDLLPLHSHPIPPMQVAKESDIAQTKGVCRSYAVAEAVRYQT